MLIFRNLREVVTAPAHFTKVSRTNFREVHLNQHPKESLSFLKQETTSAEKEKIAVFTHHCPTFLNYPEQYKGDALNEAFAVELFNFIQTSNIAVWGYGNHHTNTPEFSIGKTKLITNQLGYIQQNEHALFSGSKVIEV